MERAQDRAVADGRAQFWDLREKFGFVRFAQHGFPERRRDRFHLGGNGSIVIGQVGVVAARIHDAEVVARARNIKIDLFDHGFLRVGKVDGNDPADGAGNLIHQSAGFAEEYVLRILREFGDLHVVHASVVVEVAQNVADHILKRRGRRNPRAFEHIGSRISVKAADGMTVLAEACRHARDQSPRAFGFPVRGCAEDVDVYHVLAEAFALDTDHAPLAFCGNGNDVEVNRRGDHTTVVVVGMVAREFASARDRIERGVAIGPVKVFKFSDGFRIAFFLRGERVGAVDVGQALVKLPAFESRKQFGGFHLGSPLALIEFFQFGKTFGANPLAFE